MDVQKLKADMLNNTSQRVLGRAKDYVKKGKVKQVQTQGALIQAVVEGSNDYYRVDLYKNVDGTYGAACTCPYGCMKGDWCKHAAAVVLYGEHNGFSGARQVKVKKLLAETGPVPEEILELLDTIEVFPDVEDYVAALSTYTHVPHETWTVSK